MRQLKVFLIAFVSMLPQAFAGDRPFDSFEPSPVLVAPIPKDAYNPCAKINIAYAEHIESRGFLGLATPSAHRRNIERAIFLNTFLAWKSQELREAMKSNTPWSEADYFRTVPHELRPPGASMGLMAFDFRMYELCTLANKRGLKKLTFACNAEGVDHENGNGDTTHQNVLAECFISTHMGGKPSWKELKSARWGASVSNSDMFTPHGPDSIDSDGIRQMEYFPLIRRLVSGIVVGDIEGARLRASRENTDVSNCGTGAENSGAPTVPLNVFSSSGK